MGDLELSKQPLGLFIQPACLQHRYIRHPNASHIFERPERLRAVLLGVAAAVARIEEAESILSALPSNESSSSLKPSSSTFGLGPTASASDDLSGLLSGLSISKDFRFPATHLDIVSPPLPPSSPGQILLHHPALQLAHSPPPTGSMHEACLTSASPYLKDLYKWASEAVNTIKETGCEIPSGLGLNQGDLYLGPGSVLAIEGAIQTVCQAIDKVCLALTDASQKLDTAPSTPPARSAASDPMDSAPSFSKAFCAIRPPGHHCGEDTPSGFCYVNNVVVGALHAYLEHDIDRAIIIDFDLHHGNGTQALVMPLNAASHAEDIAVKGGKPNPPVFGRNGKRRRGWKGFYGSVHDIYSYPCEDGDLDLIKDASISLAGHGQWIENIHLQPYSSEEDFYERIYPKYLALLDKAKVFMDETGADPGRTIVLISAGFDACEHEHQLMQRHDRRVPTSFFSRYTRDIAHFAERYTDGKIVSVLEGGYSDRALTSAAMGHVVGMLGRLGDPTWWTEAELVNIERATKKKRTGPLAPFPRELSHITYLARTYALLGLFEGSPPDLPASAANTPQHGRMTLRERGKTPYGDLLDTTPPNAARRGRGRGASTPNGTPRAKTEAATPSGRKSRAVTPAKSSIPVAHDPMPEIKREPMPSATQVKVEKDMQPPTGRTVDPSRVPLPDSPATNPHLPRIVPHQPSPLRAQPGSTFRPSSSTMAVPNLLSAESQRLTGAQRPTSPNGQPKIMLRISRTPSPVAGAAPTSISSSSKPTAEGSASLSTNRQAPSNTQQRLPYPPLYPSIEHHGRPPRGDGMDIDDGRGYRERSAGTTASGTSDDYLSPESGTTEASSAYTRGESVGSSTSSGPAMPGKFR